MDMMEKDPEEIRLSFDMDIKAGIKDLKMSSDMNHDVILMV
jgi:hypothetical protein